jgi:hypothetical protein
MDGEQRYLKPVKTQTASPQPYSLYHIASFGFKRESCSRKKITQLITNVTFWSIFLISMMNFAESDFIFT